MRWVLLGLLAHGAALAHPGQGAPVHLHAAEVAAGLFLGLTAAAWIVVRRRRSKARRSS